MLTGSGLQKVQDNNCVTKSFEKLVVYYPHLTTGELMVAPRRAIGRRTEINVCAVDNGELMKRPSEYTEMAQSLSISASR